MINLEPIPKKIQKRLFEKMRALGRHNITTTGESIDTDALTHDKMASRTTFIRMTSGQVKAVTLMGGMLKRDGGIRAGYDDIYGPRNYPSIREEESLIDDMERYLHGFDEYKSEELLEYTGPLGKVEVKYMTAGKTLPNKEKRPMPGIKSIDVQFKGGLKALREATINWTCWGFEDLNELSPHFLAHGKTVMLQWGWVYDDNSFRNIPEFLVTDDAGNRFISDDAFNNYKNQIIDGKGDFEIMTGIVKNFEYTTREDGAFDCTTILTSVGVNLISNPQPNEESLPKHITYNLSLSDTNEDITKKLINATSHESGELKKLNSKEKSKLINLNTNVSLKLFLKKIDHYIYEQLWSLFEGRGPHSPDDEASGRKIVPGLSSIRDAYTYKKNSFIQHQFFSIGGSGNPGTYSIGSDTWVSWGWFEDNILSKFTSQVNSDGRVISTFRSIESVLTTDDKDSGKYESVRIKNHKYLQTIDTRNYILPGQFIPHEKRVGEDALKDPKNPNDSIELPGDSASVRKLASVVNQNFDSFTSSDEFSKVTSKKTVGTGKYEQIEIMKMDYGKWGKSDNEMKPTGKYKKGKEITKTITEESLKPKPGRFGYLRNMLINTKAIKEAFGVSDKPETFTVESLSIEEAINNLFSILNRPINFWNFQITTDVVDTERVKIIDEGTTSFNFEKPVNTQRSQENSDGDVFTEDKKGDAGVFFFPVWRADSIVKRQNVTAKVPDAMALTAMYGSNLDQIKEFSNVGTAHEDTGAVIAGGLFNSDKDINNRGLTSAIKSGTTEDTQWQNIGSVNHTDNLRLIKKGPDGVLSYIKERAGDLQKTYDDRLAEVVKTNTAAQVIQQQAEADEAFAKLFDTSLPPPLLDQLDDDEIYTLLKGAESLQSNDFIDGLFGQKDLDTFKELFSSKYEVTSIGRGASKMKRPFIETVKYLTSGIRGEVKTKKSSVLIPLDVELDIDGTGGIFPGNSFHSTYLPSNYKNKAVFQAFDVSHKVDSSGWTTSITGKMRSTINNIFTAVKSYDELENDVFANYIKKQAATAEKQAEEIAADQKSVDDAAAMEELRRKNRNRSGRPE